MGERVRGSPCSPPNIYLTNAIFMKQKKIYGIVEGFFSYPRKPWNVKERLTVIDFMIKNCPGLNTYLYCPKDDPFVTKYWNKKYPQKQLMDIKQAYEKCTKNNVTFIYGLNPSFDLLIIKKDFEKYVKEIFTKLRQLQGIGITSFAILYDDVPYAYNVTGNVQSRSDADSGKIQARILNAVQNYLGNNIAVYFCPSDYFLTKETAYTKKLFQTLNKSIRVFWTGPKIFSPKITKADLKSATKVSNNSRLIWWDNYPVNDCEHPGGAFHIGAFNALNTQTQQKISGILINPMREPYANFVALLSFEEYLKSKTYNRTRAAKKAFNFLFGKNYKSYYRLLTSFSAVNAVDRIPRGYLQEMLEAKNVQQIQNILTRIQDDLFIVKNNIIDNASGIKFYQTLSGLIFRASRYIRLCEKILKEKKWVKDFAKLDLFPVRLGKFDFRRQIMAAIISRRNTTQWAAKEEQNFALLQILLKKYNNKNSLEAKKEDKVNFFRLLKKILAIDDIKYIKTLKNQNKLDCIKTITKRLCANQYS